MKMSELIDYLGVKLEDTNDNHYSVNDKINALNTSALKLCSVLDPFYLKKLTVQINDLKVANNLLKFEDFYNSGIQEGIGLQQSTGCTQTGDFLYVEQLEQNPANKVHSDQSESGWNQYYGQQKIFSNDFEGDNDALNGHCVDYITFTNTNEMTIDAPFNYIVADMETDYATQYATGNKARIYFVEDAEMNSLADGHPIGLKPGNNDVSGWVIGDKVQLSNFTETTGLNLVTGIITKIKEGSNDEGHNWLVIEGLDEDFPNTVLMHTLPFETTGGTITRVGLSAEQGLPLKNGIHMVYDNVSQVELVEKTSKDFRTYTTPAYGNQFRVKHDGITFNPPIADGNNINIQYLQIPPSFTDTETDHYFDGEIEQILLDLAEAELWENDNRVNRAEVAKKRGFETIQILNGRLTINE